MKRKAPMMIRNALLSVALILSPTLSHSQDTDPEKKALIDDLLEQTGQLEAEGL